MKKADTLYFQQAKAEYSKFKSDPLFWAGIMLYAGKGDKTHKYQIRLATQEFYLAKIFVLFLNNYLGVTRETVRCSLFIGQNDNFSLCREMWSNAVLIPREQFYKHQVRKTVNTRQKKLHYGIGTIILSDTVIKQKLLFWLSLTEDERFDNAVMV
jgi:hypothetical protein